MPHSLPRWVTDRIKRAGDAVLLFPVHYDAAALKAELDALDGDVQMERHQPTETQARDFED